ncbi:MAG: hypothetical protein DDT19_02950 [Syntrophomonadaceae bacterium]|nr:hypothetical protein [Bacillota bacterium]
MKIYDIENKKDWLREFRDSTRLPEDHPDHIDISDCDTK